MLIWYGGIWEPSKHVPDLHRFFPAHVAVIGVETRTLTEGMSEKASPPVSYVMNDACRAVQFVRLNAVKWNLDPLPPDRQNCVKTEAITIYVPPGVTFPVSQFT